MPFQYLTYCPVCPVHGPPYNQNTLSQPLDFYSSNTDIQIPVTVHDWLGQLCEGDDTVQPLTYVRATSSLVREQRPCPAGGSSPACE